MGKPFSVLFPYQQHLIEQLIYSIQQIVDEYVVIQESPLKPNTDLLSKNHLLNVYHNTVHSWLEKKDCNTR